MAPLGQCRLGGACTMNSISKANIKFGALFALEMAPPLRAWEPVLRCRQVLASLTSVNMRVNALKTVVLCNESVTKRKLWKVRCAGRLPPVQITTRDLVLIPSGLRGVILCSKSASALSRCPWKLRVRPEQLPSFISPLSVVIKSISQLQVHLEVWPSHHLQLHRKSKQEG
eukprot:2416020-Amphidinium_carterae.1